MQRTVETTVLLKILNKYQERFDECERKWKESYDELQALDEKRNKEGLEYNENARRSFLLDDISMVNTQISAYECIIKDLKGIIS